MEKAAYQLVKPVTVWFTGLPSSGKTTLAHRLEAQCKIWGILPEMLDGDVVRTHLSKGLGFSKEDRNINIERIGFVCHLLVKHGAMVIVSAISPYREAREHNRRMIGNFVEIYVKTSGAECERRDVKGLYKKARRGEIRGMTGVDDPYEEPLNADVVCETEKEPPDSLVAKVVAKLEALGYLRRSA
ncbi:MAG: adenylyl-sulfate kinase [Candidatus Omnitrophota bacterium]